MSKIQLTHKTCAMHLNVSQAHCLQAQLDHLFVYLNGKLYIEFDIIYILTLRCLFSIIEYKTRANIEQNLIL